MVDLPRMEDGGLAAVVMAVFREQGELTDEGRALAVRAGFEKLGQIESQIRANAEKCLLARTADEIEAAFKSGRKAIILGMENGYQIGLDLDNLNRVFDRGIRILTLTHNSDNDIGDSSTDDKNPEDRGLSGFGLQVVERANRLGLAIDLSHASEKTFFDVVRLSKAPVIASHSCVRGAHADPRNLSDEQLQALRDNGGVVGIMFVFLKDRVVVPDMEREMQALNDRVSAKGGWQALKPAEAADFQNEIRQIKYRYPQDSASVKDVVDHIDHVVRTIGVDHVGIGSDFDGGGYLSDCRDVSEFPSLTEELVRRGYSETDIRKIWGGNYLRVLRRVQAVGSPRTGTGSGPHSFEGPVFQAPLT
jgi:membrane dipeptidase